MFDSLEDAIGQELNYITKYGNYDGKLVGVTDEGLCQILTTGTIKKTPESSPQKMIQEFYIPKCEIKVWFTKAEQSRIIDINTDSSKPFQA